MKITILGSGSAKPTPHRHHAAHVLNVCEQLFLIDCGEGTQYQLQLFGISPLRINHIFISHLHGDHTLGLPGLIFTMAMMGRQTPLWLYGPARVGEMIHSMMQFYDSDFEYQLHFTAVDTTQNSVIFENKVVSVESIPLRHRVPTTGYLFRQKPPLLNIRKEAIQEYGLNLSQIVAAKNGDPIMTDSGELIENHRLTLPQVQTSSFAYCSDTTPSGRVAEIVRGVTLLYHEATFAHELRSIAHTTGHTTATQAGRLAAKAHVGQLVIGHFSSRYTDLETLLAQSQAEFPNTILATDGLRIHF